MNFEKIRKNTGYLYKKSGFLYKSSGGKVGVKYLKCYNEYCPGTAMIKNQTLTEIVIIISIICVNRQIFVEWYVFSK